MKNFVGFVGFCVFAGIIYISFIPEGRAKWNSYWNKMQKVDDATLYQTRKSVEYQCRAMQASYMTDKVIYELYWDSEDREERGWGQNAKIRANKTAIIYNEFILKNSYVWKDNVPDDIKEELSKIE